MTTTGWPPGMLQDDSRELSRWLASRYQLSRNDMDTDKHHLTEPDDYRAWYEEAMVASNEAGFVGLSAAETIRALASAKPAGAVADDTIPEPDRIKWHGQWYLREQATPPAAPAGLTDAAMLPPGWRVQKNPDGSIGLYAPPPVDGESRRTSENFSGKLGNDKNEIVFKLLSHVLASTPAPVMAVAPEAGLRYSKDTSGGQIKRLRDMADGARLYRVPDADQFARTLDDIANMLLAAYSSGVPDGYKLVPIAAQGAPVMAEAVGLTDAEADAAIEAIGAVPIPHTSPGARAEWLADRRKTLRAAITAATLKGQ